MEYKPYSQFTPSAFLEPVFEPVTETPVSSYLSPEFSTLNLSERLFPLEEEPIESYARIINKVKLLLGFTCNAKIYEPETGSESQEERDTRSLLDLVSKCVVRMTQMYLSSHPKDSEDEVMVAAITVSVSVFGLDDAPECRSMKSNISRFVNDRLKPKSLNPAGIWRRIRKIQGDLLEMENYRPCKMEIGYVEEIQGCSRCHAITKEGKQCMRDAETGEQTCWQHNR